MLLWFLRRTTHFLWTTEWEREWWKGLKTFGQELLPCLPCVSVAVVLMIVLSQWKTHLFLRMFYTPYLYIYYIYIYIITTKKSNSVSIFVFLSTFRGSLFRIGWGEGKKTKTEWWIEHFFFCQVSLFLNCNLCVHELQCTRNFCTFFCFGFLCFSVGIMETKVIFSLCRLLSKFFSIVACFGCLFANSFSVNRKKLSSSLPPYIIL